MEVNASSQGQDGPGIPARKPWEEPRIVLERSLEAAAHRGLPNSRGLLSNSNGFLGPLDASGGVC